MPPEDDLTAADLAEFAAALGALRPAPPSRRDRILFEAGVAAGRAQARREAARRRWRWPAVAATLALLAVGEGARLARRQGGERLLRTGVVDTSRTRSPLEPTLSLPPPGGNPADAPPRVARAGLPSPRDRLIERTIRDDGRPGPAGPDFGPPAPLLSGRDLLRRELRSALHDGGPS